MSSATQANHAWLRDYAKHYKSRWVALRNGNLVCFSPEKKTLLVRLGTDTERIDILWIDETGEAGDE